MDKNPLAEKVEFGAGDEEQDVQTRGMRQRHKSKHQAVQEEKEEEEEEWSKPLKLPSHRFGSTVEAMKAILQERLQLRTGEQIVDAPVPQGGKMTAAETDAEDRPGVLIQGLGSEVAVTKANNLTSKSRLGGIPFALRDAPQIEVTFDIGANEVLNASAQDKSTEAQQERQWHRSKQA